MPHVTSICHVLRICRAPILPIIYHTNMADAHYHIIIICLYGGNRILDSVKSQLITVMYNNMMGYDYCIMIDNNFDLFIYINVLKYTIRIIERFH